MRRAGASKIRRRVGQGLDPRGPIATQRAAFARLLQLTEVGMPAHACRACSVGGVDGLELVPELSGVDAPRARARVIYVHGGGYSLGAPEVQRPLAARVATALGAKLWMPRYRLAPEHAYPAAIEDLCAVWRALDGRARGQTLLVGDSAGAGLVLALAQHLRARGLERPAALVLMSPWIDLSVSGASVETNAAHELLFSRAGLELMARRYAGATAPEDPRVSPLFGAFEGLPPMLIQAGGHEMLLDDARRAAVRAEQAGVEVELQIYEGQAHVFQATPMLEPAARAIAAIASWVEAKLPASSS